MLLVAAIGLAVVPRTSVVIRRALWIYGLIALPLFIVPNPIGGNLARPGQFAGRPGRDDRVAQPPGLG